MKKRIIIIGGLSAGPSAAAKARRENEEAEILLFEKSENISYATCGIPYALSGVIKSRENLLVLDPDVLINRFRIKLHLNEEVVDVKPEEHIIVTPKGEYKYDKLIYTTGASAIVPPITNIKETQNWSTCRTLADYDNIMKQGLADTAKNVAVLGGGLIGIEVAENLLEAGKNVTLIEGQEHILSIWDKKFTTMAKKVLEEKGIKVVTGVFASEFVHQNSALSSIKLSDGNSVDADYAILSVGIRPNTEMLTKLGAESIGNGALIVNEKMETSLKDIYAAGDNCSIKNTITGEHGYMPLGTHSNKGGRTAGINALDKTIGYKGGYGTAIIKIFDYTLARTGMNADSLKKAGIPYSSSLIVSGATPGYYPGQTEIIQEIYFHKETGVLLGAEAIGEKGVDKRIDVMSTAIYAKLKVSDLEHLDLAYAPPFSPAKDPVVISGMMATNQISGKYNEIDINEFLNIQSKESITLVDVRTKSEATQGMIEGAINIDVNNLREELHKLDKNDNIVLYCAKGLRGYLAYLILNHNGFKNVRNLSGGYKVWELVN